MRIFSLLVGTLFVCSFAKAKQLRVVRTLNHSGYSEGLDFHNGYLWHALPKVLKKINPKDGSTIETYKPATKYSESLVWFQGVLWNVSYSDNGLYSGKLKGKQFQFTRKADVPEKHAWGLTHNGKEFIVTGNYSNKLYFIDAKTLQLVRTIETKVKDLEDLAWDGRWIWTSSFTAHRGQIFPVDPKTGEIGEFYSLPDPSECPVIDGIAYGKGHLWITGKHCVHIYKVAVPKQRSLTFQSSKPKKTK